MIPPGEIPMAAVFIPMTDPTDVSIHQKMLWKPFTITYNPPIRWWYTGSQNGVGTSEHHRLQIANKFTSPDPEYYMPQQFLYFLPLPHGHGLFGYIFVFFFLN